MIKKKSRILYLIPESDWDSDAVLQSQVVTPALMLQQYGFDCAVLAAAERRHVPPAISGRGSEGGIRHIAWHASAESSSISQMLSLASRAISETSAQWGGFEPTIVYTRSFLHLPAARRLARHYGAVHVHDVRGLWAAEYAIGRKQTTLLHWLLEAWEMRRVRQADRLLCVSHRLADWLMGRIHRSVDGIVPCCIDTRMFKFNPEARSRIRRELHWDNNKVLVYCGGSNAWQRLPDVMRLMRDALDRNPSVRFLFLTTVAADLQAQAQVAGLPASHFVIRSVPYQGVPEWMSAADMAVILRDNILLNHVASPIKMAEYLACGLPVACSEAIGDISELVSRETLGVVLPSAGDLQASCLLEFLRGIQASDRQRCIDFAARHFSWETYLPVYEKVFAP